MILGKVLSLHSINILTLLVYCYLGSVKDDSTSLNVPVLSAISIGLFFITSFILIYLNRTITYRAIFGSRVRLLLIILVILATVLTKTTIFIVPLLFALTAMSNDLRLLLKYYLLWSVLIFIGVIALQAFGVISGGDVVQESGGIEMIAESLGFGNPNGAFTYLFSILITGYVLLYKSPKKILFSALAITSIIVIYSLTLSRTGLICCLLIVFFAHVGKIMPWKKMKNMLPMLFIIFTMSSILLAVQAGETGGTINDLLSNRPFWWNMRIEDGALSNLLGNADSFASNYAWWRETAPLDSFFLRIWFRNGLLILVLFYVFFRAWSKGAYDEMLVFGTLVTLLYGFSEYGVMSNPGKNIILLLMMVPVFSNRLIDRKPNLLGNIHHDK